MVSNPNVATFIKELTLKLPEGENVNFPRGGYVQLECPPHEIAFKDFDIQENIAAIGSISNSLTLKVVNKENTIRAYSMANYPEEKA